MSILMVASDSIKEICVHFATESTPMEIILKSIVIDFDGLYSMFYVYVVSTNIGRYWSNGMDDICRDIARYLLRRNVIVSSLRFLNSPRNKTHPRHQDDSVAQTYRRRR